MVDNLIIAEGLEEALKQKTRNSSFLAGGTEINRLGSTVQARKLISIGRIGELDGISDADNAVKIGAMCTFQDIIDSSLVPDYLKEACRFMGSRTKRNMATIGGNIALRRTDSYLYATLIACGAKLELLGKEGETETRCVCCYLRHHDNFKDMLIKSITVPKDALVFSKRYSNTVQSHAVLTVAIGKAQCKERALRLAVAAKDTALTRLDDIADELEKRDLSDAEILKMIEQNKELDFKADIYGSPEYKRYLLAVTIADLAKKVKEARR